MDKLELVANEIESLGGKAFFFVCVWVKFYRARAKFPIVFFPTATKSPKTGLSIISALLCRISL